MPITEDDRSARDIVSEAEKRICVRGEAQVFQGGG